MNKTIILKNLDDSEIELNLLPANRNVRLTLNKINQEELKERSKLVSSKKYKSLYDNLENKGDYSPEIAILKGLEDGSAILTQELIADGDAITDKYIIQGVKALINMNSKIEIKTAELIKSNYDSEFWSYQDLGVLSETLLDFRKLFRRG